MLPIEMRKEYKGGQRAISRTQNRQVLPAISMTSDAFRNGWETVTRGEYVGWPIQQTPGEETVVQFLKDAVVIISSDMASGHDCEYELAWIAGLFASWLRRE
jgi:hypothetical protein